MLTPRGRDCLTPGCGDHLPAGIDGGAASIALTRTDREFAVDAGPVVGARKQTGTRTRHVSRWRTGNWHLGELQPRHKDHEGQDKASQSLHESKWLARAGEGEHSRNHHRDSCQQDGDANREDRDDSHRDQAGGTESEKQRRSAIQPGPAGEPRSHAGDRDESGHEGDPEREHTGVVLARNDYQVGRGDQDRKNRPSQGELAHRLKRKLAPLVGLRQQPESFGAAR